MESKKNECWIYADVSCAVYPLDNIDTVSINGDCDVSSALYSIMNSVCKNQFF